MKVFLGYNIKIVDVVGGLTFGGGRIKFWWISTRENFSRGRDGQLSAGGEGDRGGGNVLKTFFFSTNDYHIGFLNARKVKMFG